MKRMLSALVCGAIFGAGLVIGGMTQPSKVVGFLDLFGNWDASLAFVMIGAIAVYFVAYHWSRKMPSPLLTADFSLPRRGDLDANLLLGAAIFGAGWGLGGFCPGPALTSLASGAPAVLIFVAAMVVGMYAYTWLTELRAATSDWAASSSKDILDA